MANRAIFPNITKLLSLKMDMEWLYHRKTQWNTLKRWVSWGKGCGARNPKP